MGSREPRGSTPGEAERTGPSRTSPRGKDVLVQGPGLRTSGPQGCPHQAQPPRSTRLPSTGDTDVFVPRDISQSPYHKLPFHPGHD